MKLQHIILGLFCGLMLVACDYESFEEETALSGLQEGNPFVRLLTGGADGTAETTVSPTSTGFAVSVESQVVRDADVTVNYTLGGSAAYGTVYEIDGASAAGGSVTIPFDDGAGGTSFTSEDININFLVDTLLNGPETIVVELADATATNGVSVDAGQGPLRKSLTITLVND